MEREEIIRKLMGRGVMVTPEILKKIEETGINDFLDKTDQGNSTVVDDVGGERMMKCIVGSSNTLSEMTPQDVITANMEKYEKIRKQLLRRVNAVSVSNIGRSSSKLCIVGMVKETMNGGFVLEDSTGEVEVKSEKKVELDDVIGVSGWVREKTLFAEEILYADIPMSREAVRMDNTLLLTSDPEKPAAGADVVITPYSLIEKDEERDIPNPAWVFLQNGSKKMTVLVYRTDDHIGKEEAISWLKKRYLGGDTSPAPESGRILETVPDILWIVSKNDFWTENYKGVTIVSFGAGRNAVIDLRTRKVETS